MFTNSEDFRAAFKAAKKGNAKLEKVSDDRKSRIGVAGGEGAYAAPKGIEFTFPNFPLDDCLRDQAISDDAGAQKASLVGVEAGDKVILLYASQLCGADKDGKPFGPVQAFIRDAGGLDLAWPQLQGRKFICNEKKSFEVPTKWEKGDDGRMRPVTFGPKVKPVFSFVGAPATQVASTVDEDE